jgi:hypothetical protein
LSVARLRQTLGRIAMVCGMTLIGLVGCLIAATQFGPGQAHDNPLWLAAFSAPFVVAILAVWAVGLGEARRRLRRPDRE